MQTEVGGAIFLDKAKTNERKKERKKERKINTALGCVSK